MGIWRGFLWFAVAVGCGWVGGRGMAVQAVAADGGGPSCYLIWRIGIPCCLGFCELCAFLLARSCLLRMTLHWCGCWWVLVCFGGRWQLGVAVFDVLPGFARASMGKTRRTLLWV